MIKRKNIFTLLFLVLLTVGVIVIPISFNSFGLEYSYEKKTYWEYEAQASYLLTSEQVIDFFTNSYSTKSFIGSEENSNAEAVEGNTTAIIDLIFNNEAKICSYLKNFIGKNINDFQTCTLNQYYFTSIEGFPAALNIIYVHISTENELLQLLYESKTKTLFSLTYIIENNDNEKPFNISDLADVIIRYCESDLNLSKAQYFTDAGTENFVYGIKQAYYDEFKSEQYTYN